MATQPECVLAPLTVEQLRVGHILDALDQYDTWHLAIVIDEQDAQKQLHFLPYKANRDEAFQAPEDNARLAPTFSRIAMPQSAQTVKSQLQTLKAYMDSYRQKLGKKTEEIKQPKARQEPTKKQKPAQLQYSAPTSHGSSELADTQPSAGNTLNSEPEARLKGREISED